MSLVRTLALIVASACLAAVARADDVKEKDNARRKDGIARKAAEVMQQLCHRCHHGEGSASGSDADFLKRDDLISNNLIKPDNPSASRLLARIMKQDMPPAGELPEARLQDVAALWEWIKE